MNDLVAWLRATLVSTESDVRAFLDSDMRVYQDGAGVPWAELALAGVEAKRRHIARYEAVDRLLKDSGSAGEWDRPGEPIRNELLSVRRAYRLVIADDALPYADQPGYREEWRP